MLPSMAALTIGTIPEPPAWQDLIALESASELLRGNHEIVLMAVGQDGLALKYASELLRNNHEIALMAVGQDVKAFEFVETERQQDPEVMFRCTGKVHRLHGVTLAYDTDSLGA